MSSNLNKIPKLSTESDPRYAGLINVEAGPHNTVIENMTMGGGKFLNNEDIVGAINTALGLILYLGDGGSGITKLSNIPREENSTIMFMEWISNVLLPQILPAEYAQFVAQQDGLQPGTDIKQEIIHVFASWSKHIASLRPQLEELSTNQVINWLHSESDGKISIDKPQWLKLEELFNNFQAKLSRFESELIVQAKLDNLVTNWKKLYGLNIPDNYYPILQRALETHTLAFGTLDIVIPCQLEDNGSGRSKLGIVLFHAGDSRVYKFNKEGKSTRLTRDHNDDATNANALTTSVNADGVMDYSGRKIESLIELIEVASDDTLLMLSDGVEKLFRFHGSVTDEISYNIALELAYKEYIGRKDIPFIQAFMEIMQKNNLPLRIGEGDDKSMQAFHFTSPDWAIATQEVNAVSVS